eukprot:1158804-Pelagomonas_calceolata.AAC.4
MQVKQTAGHVCVRALAQGWHDCGDRAVHIQPAHPAGALRAGVHAAAASRPLSHPSRPARQWAHQVYACGPGWVCGCSMCQHQHQQWASLLHMSEPPAPSDVDTQREDARREQTSLMGAHLFSFRSRTWWGTPTKLFGRAISLNIPFKGGTWWGSALSVGPNLPVCWSMSGVSSIDVYAVAYLYLLQHKHTGHTDAHTDARERREKGYTAHTHTTHAHTGHTAAHRVAIKGGTLACAHRGDKGASAAAAATDHHTPTAFDDHMSATLDSLDVSAGDMGVCAGAWSTHMVVFSTPWEDSSVEVLAVYRCKEVRVPLQGDAKYRCKEVHSLIQVDAKYGC